MPSTVTFLDDHAKAAWLIRAAERDACCPSVVSAALAFCGLAPEVRAAAIQAWARDSIRYVRDPYWQEEFADSETVLRRGWDDCDGKARVFVAVCLAACLDARIFPVFDAGGSFVHVQALVRWPGSSTRPDARAGGWVLAELTLAGVQLGQGVEHARRDAAGRMVTR